MENPAYTSAGTGTQVDPATISVTLTTINTLNCRAAAFKWFGFGFGVIPLVPGTKQTALKWDPWLDNLSAGNINTHWTENPDHELGFIVSDNLLVLDADSPQSIAALAEIENALDVTPNLTVKTTKGVHHYFKLATGVFAKTDSHSTELYPERIDVKARRSMVILPPSTGKEVLIDEAENFGDLIEVGQDFVDAIFKHNGRPAPRPKGLSTEPPAQHAPSSQSMTELSAMVQKLNPDCGREDWIHIGMAIKTETSGSEEGFALWDSWSGNGSKYPGKAEIRVQWDSFRTNIASPITVASIRKMVKDSGYDWMEICADAGEQFEVLETEVIDSKPTSPEVPDSKPVASPVKQTVHPLQRFSLTGKSAELEKMTVEQVAILGQIALKGQSTIIYASPNTGKTLLTLYLIIEGIKAGRIDASMLYYLNMDDTGDGLLQKLHLAEEYGFHMLSEGHRNFMISEFLGILTELIDANQCHGTIIVLDTLKKFTNLMDKQKASSFTKVIRRFVVKGGTLIALAHTNKKPGPDGKPVYSGTTDIIDDSDCAYTLAPVTIDEHGTKVVEFDNIKRRGNVVQTAGYSYTIGQYASYGELLTTVCEVDPTSLEPMKQAEQLKSDAEVIQAVIACIREGINTKMMLAEATAAKSGISKRSALQMIEKYSGSDPAVHRWAYSVRDRGAKVFEVLEPATPAHKPENSDT